MGSVEKATRQLFAGQKADKRIPRGHPQREELEHKQQQFEQDFTSTVLNLFDKVFFPVQRLGRPAQLVHKSLDTTRDTTKPFNGEEQIVATLTKDPLKLYLDIEENFNSILTKAEDLLWPENQDEGRWSDILERQSEQSGMVWLPPKGLEQLKVLTCNRGIWEDLGNGYVTKKPKKKKTSAQIIPESNPDDEGYVRLRINPINAGPAPRIYVAEDGPVSEQSKLLTEMEYKTNALRIYIHVIDPSGQYETGGPVKYENNLVIRNELIEKNGKREVNLYIAPRGNIKYTLDGSEPREGIAYTTPIEIGDGAVLLRVFGACDGLESKEEFHFPTKGQRGAEVNDIKPAKLINNNRGKSLDSRSKTFAGLQVAKDKGIAFEKVSLNIGQGEQAVRIIIGNISVTAEYIESVLNALLTKFNDFTPVNMTFHKASFSSGHDLKHFAEAMGIIVQEDEVEQ